MSHLNRDDRLLVIIGPSGAGKSSVIRRLQDQGAIAVTPSWTTRPPRPDENTGSIEHRFVSEEEFKRREAEEFFLETVRMFGLPFWYGLPKIKKPMDNKVPIIMLRVTLLALLKKYYSNYTVYQIEDELQKIKTRLLQREAVGQQLGSRLRDYQKEITEGRKLAKRVFTNSSTLKLLDKQIKEALREDF